MSLRMHVHYQVNHRFAYVLDTLLVIIRKHCPVITEKKNPRQSEHAYYCSHIINFNLLQVCPSICIFLFIPSLRTSHYLCISGGGGGVSSISCYIFLGYDHPPPQTHRHTHTRTHTHTHTPKKEKLHKKTAAKILVKKYLTKPKLFCFGLLIVWKYH